MTRKQEREQAFILIFEKSFREETLEDILEDARASENYIENEYSEKCLRGVFDKIEDIDCLIEKNLKNWKLDRISKVALNILRLAIFEMKYVEEVPEGVAINEAVELSKKYSTTEDASFVNGVLGSISRS